jgi:3',5'-cyclic AMP phosphodiesterase CpdA
VCVVRFPRSGRPVRAEPAAIRAPARSAAIALVAILATLSCARAPEPSAPSPPAALHRLIRPHDDPVRAGFFLQMADTQFGFYSTPLLFAWLRIPWKEDVFGKETRNFERAAAAAKLLKPAFVVICGDLVNRPGNEVQANEFLRIAGQIDDVAPLYLVPGNHDVGNEPTPESMRWYRETFTEESTNWYSFRQGDVFGIVLDSSIIRTPDTVKNEAAAQLEWLRAELGVAQASGARHILVFQHHPYFLDRRDEPDAYYNLPRDRRTLYLDLFREAGVTAVLAGHYHRNHHAWDGPLELITTGPVGRPLGSDPPGFRVVRPAADGLEHAYFGLDLASNPGSSR